MSSYIKTYSTLGRNIKHYTDFNPAFLKSYPAAVEITLYFTYRNNNSYLEALDWFNQVLELYSSQLAADVT